MRTFATTVAGIVSYFLVCAVIANVPACTSDQKVKVTDTLGNVFDLVDKLTDLFMTLNGKGELSDAGLVAADANLRRQYPTVFETSASGTGGFANEQRWDAAVTAAKARLRHN